MGNAVGGAAAEQGVGGPAPRAVVAENVRRIRLARGMSLRELSEATGVSKALLSQIERGVANPTIEVLSRVAAALGESFLELARPRMAGPEVLRADPDGGAAEQSVRMLFGSWERRRFELSEGWIPAGTRSVKNSHGPGSVEYAYVVSGTVTVAAEGWTVDLGPGDALRFAAEHDHVYTTGPDPARVLTLLSYDEL
ncbi:XRE family transcriptional regulator [Actinocorallia sp. API 0066]|uniref:helix-turn-helix domain-containing protein n=1 Tax=Actinocorallia sp. API 0066 TaxID=2896846 RepID=UPI001E2B3651|nr:XRE family transcriptional regulator [Actinocorallia sp. API 0066]MCD0451660.1 XRE family transcriptional regulator [Actinocorallia sp. API 0066]